MRNFIEYLANSSRVLLPLLNLLQNRANYSVRFPPEKIQNYLCKHLQMEGDLQNFMSSSHFKIETRALVVTSSRAGMGTNQ